MKFRMELFKKEYNCNICYDKERRDSYLGCNVDAVQKQLTSIVSLIKEM
jgi:hypothetical protein